MSEEILMGTVDRTVPNAATASSDTVSATSQPEVGTVGTVIPDCTCVRAGMNIERAQEDFPETQLELSPTVPGPREWWWDVHRFTVPFGHGKRLGRVRGATRAAAERAAVERYGKQIDVTLAGGGRGTRRDSLGRLRGRRHSK